MYQKNGFCWATRSSTGGRYISRYISRRMCICIWMDIDTYRGGPSTGSTLLFIVVVSPCRYAPLLAGCCGGEGVLGVS